MSSKYKHFKGQTYTIVAAYASQALELSPYAIFVCLAYEEETLVVRPVFYDRGKYIIVTSRAFLGDFVVYRADYLVRGEDNHRVWIRKAEDFHGRLPDGRRRFEEL